MGHWRDDAACVCVPTEVFFPEGHYGNGTDRDSMLVKEMCFSCPVREECLSDALHYEQNMNKSERAGIWGGYGPRERHFMWRKMKQSSDQSLCRNGHLMDEENTYENPGGYVQCRKCKNIQRNLWKQRSLQRDRKVS